MTVTVISDSESSAGGPAARTAGSHSGHRDGAAGRGVPETLLVFSGHAGLGQDPGDLRVSSHPNPPRNC